MKTIFIKALAGVAAAVCAFGVATPSAMAREYACNTYWQSNGGPPPSGGLVTECCANYGNGWFCGSVSWRPAHDQGNNYSELSTRIQSQPLDENIEAENATGVHQAEAFAICATNSIAYYCPDEAAAGYSGECVAAITIEMTRALCSADGTDDGNSPGGFGEVP